MKKMLFVLLIGMLLLAACKSETPTGKVAIETRIEPNTRTFIDFETTKICTENGKPIIREFATTWCPHCQWIKDTYAKVVKEYVQQGKIVAYQWEVDIGDNALTTEIETTIPAEEMAIFKKFNPQQSIPTFIFGCRYLRTGNGYEVQGNLEAEEKEFRAIIDELIALENN